MRRYVVALLVVLLQALPLLPAARVAASPAQQENCRAFTETGGFSVCDDGQARFLSAFNRWGLQKIGYPISQRYVRDGFVTQAFQKAIMQWRPESGSVVLANIFDDLHAAGFDGRLLRSRQTPRQLPDGWDGNIPFDQVVARRQALLDSRPALRRAYLAAGDPLTFFGLPTSEISDMGNHFAVRLQRAVLQEWKEDVPWARAGQVTIANGGEIARELGALPAEALVATSGVGRRPVTGEVSAPSDPYAWLTVPALRERAYGGGAIERVSVIESTASFTRYLIRYPSDGLMIGGFMNVPQGRGPFPVIILNHGFMPTETYETLTYTTKYADALARAGYLVLHPNFRNHRGSDQGPNEFRVGYAIDVLNLLELAKALPEGRAEDIGMWGHSMGGAITLRVLAVTDDVKAALVYGSMSADEAEIFEWRRARLGQDEAIRRRGFPITPEEDPGLYQRVSPINYLASYTAPLSIHHGDQDEQVPYAWSVRLHEALVAAGKPVEFYPYRGAPHNFTGAAYDLLIQRSIAFFDAHLK